MSDEELMAYHKEFISWVEAENNHPGSEFVDPTDYSHVEEAFAAEFEKRGWDCDSTDDMPDAKRREVKDGYEKLDLSSLTDEELRNRKNKLIRGQRLGIESGSFDLALDPLLWDVEEELDNRGLLYDEDPDDFYNKTYGESWD